jgi:Flp pilus assembly secretin CpaC
MLLTSLVIPSAAKADPVEVPLAKKPIKLYVGQAKLVRIDGTADTLEITDQGIAAVAKEPVVAHTFKFTGKSLGVTTLLVKDNAAMTATVYIVDVTRDPERLLELQQFIVANFPGSNVVIKPTPDSKKLVVEGTVPDEESAEQIISLIISADYPGCTVINRLFVSCPSFACPYCPPSHGQRFLPRLFKSH